MTVKIARGAVMKFLDEPDAVIYKEQGLLCAALRNKLGNWCGYVGLPRGHPYFGLGVHSDDLTLECHGGLNYADDSIGYIAREIFPDTWWLGFDTCHFGDLLVYEYDFGIKSSGLNPFTGAPGIYRDLDYIKGQLSRMAKECAFKMREKRGRLGRIRRRILQFWT